MSRFQEQLDRARARNAELPDHAQLVITDGGTWASPRSATTTPDPESENAMTTAATTETTYCADCEARGVDTAMLEDDGAGHLCPVCDVHDDCEDFPCSGEDGTRTPLCALRSVPA